MLEFDAIAGMAEARLVGMLEADRRSGRTRTFDEYLSHFPKGQWQRVAALLLEAEAERAEETEETFERYEIGKELGRGGQGAVYLAYDKELDRPVALKTIHTDFAATLVKEARILADLDHPSICRVYDAGTDPRPYIAMRYVDGTTLAERLRREAKYAPKEAARIVLDLARAVSYAHERRVLHRDITPKNVMLDVEGDPHLLDFGLAKKSDGDPGLSQTGAVFGTPRYVAPEVHRHESPGHAVDIYGLGLILFECLTREPLIGAGSPEDIRTDILSGVECTAGGRLARVPVDLKTILYRAAAVEPELRYPTAEALADDLERFIEDRPILVRRIPILRRGRLWLKRNPILTMAMAACLLAVAFGISTARSNARARETEIERNAAREALAYEVPQRIYLTAVRAHQVGDYQRCLDLIESLDEGDSFDRVTVGLLEVDALNGLERHGEAIEAFDHLVETAPKSRRSDLEVFRLDLTTDRLKDPEAGLDTLRALVQEGSLTTPFRHYAAALLADTRDAVSHHLALCIDVADAPLRRQAMLKMGLTDAFLGDYTRAKSTADYLRGENPTDLDALCLYALAASLEGAPDAEKVVQQIESSVPSEPKRLRIRRTRAMAAGVRTLSKAWFRQLATRLGDDRPRERLSDLRETQARLAAVIDEVGGAEGAWARLRFPPFIARLMRGLVLSDVQARSLGGAILGAEKLRRELRAFAREEAQRFDVDILYLIRGCEVWDRGTEADDARLRAARDDFVRVLDLSGPISGLDPIAAWGILHICYRPLMDHAMADGAANEEIEKDRAAVVKALEFFKATPTESPKLRDDRLSLALAVGRTDLAKDVLGELATRELSHWRWKRDRELALTLLAAGEFESAALALAPRLDSNPDDWCRGVSEAIEEKREVSREWVTRRHVALYQLQLAERESK